MSETLKILNGVLALDRFTVGELAAFTGAKLSTVYTVLERNRHLVDRVAVEATGRKGGQRLRYQLKPGAEGKLHRQIETAAAALSFEDRGLEHARPSLYLEAADELLTDRIKTSKSPIARRQLLDTADVYLTAARKELRSAKSDQPLTRERLRRLELLGELRAALEVETSAKLNRPQADRNPMPIPIGEPLGQTSFACAANDFWSQAFQTLAKSVRPFAGQSVLFVNTSGEEGSAWTDRLETVLTEHMGFNTECLLVAPNQVERAIWKRRLGDAQGFVGMIVAVDSRRNSELAVNTIESLDDLLKNATLGCERLVLDAFHDTTFRSACYRYHAIYTGEVADLGAEQFEHIIRHGLYGPLVLASAARQVIKARGS